MPSSPVATSSAGSPSKLSQASMPPPRPSLERPRQVTSTGSSDSSDCESSASLDQSHPVRCLRCQRTLSGGAEALLGRNVARDLDWSTNGDGRVRLGFNLYYCARCANMVGLKS